MIPYASIISYAALGAACAWGGWSVQGWRMGDQLSQLKTEYATAQVRAVERAQSETIRLQAQADEAARKSAARQAKMADDVAAGRDALARLRNTITDTAPVCVSSNPEAAPSANTDPARELFAQCAGTLADMAREADGHLNDKLMLLESWPVQSKD